MKIGILTSCQHSMFSSGMTNTTIALYELFKLLDHEVFLLNTNTRSEWFDDCKNLKTKIETIQISRDQITFENPMDLLIELFPYFENEKERKKFGKDSVFLFRKNILIPLIESSLYPMILQKYNFDGVSSIWTFDMFTDNIEKQILETLCKKPIITCPYIWTPTIIETHREEHGMPIWILVQDFEKDLVWNPHIFESNISSTSSCVIPLCILREAKLNKIHFENYKVHNAEHVLKTDYFKDNIKKHIEFNDLSGSYVGRQRAMDLVFEQKSLVISHNRFIPFKPILFDLAWFGIPFIHNSEVLNKISCFERYYYPNNKISSGVECLKNMNEDFKEKKGWIDVNNVIEFRKYIFENVYPMNENILNVYKKILTINSVKDSKKTYNFLFTDMWENFNPSYNFFTLLL